MKGRVPQERTQSGLGLLNRRAVLREILLSGPLSRTEISRCVGISLPAASRLARGLLDEGLLRKLPQQGAATGRTAPGRREAFLDIDPQGGYVLGIGIGPTFQTVTVADLGNDIVEGTHLAFGTLEDPDNVTQRVAWESQRLIGTLPDGRARLLGALVMVSGSVDPASGGIVAAPYLGWGAYPLEARLSGALDLPVKVQSMATTIARMEALFGAARGRSAVLTLVCGLGIGAALILDGRLVEDGRLPAGEVGKLEMAAEDGAAASLDDLASGLGILPRLWGDRVRSEGTPIPEMAEALRETIERDGGGDPAVSALMASAGRELGRAAVRLTSLIPPELVLISGPLSMSQSYVAAAREVIAKGMARPPDVLTSGVTGPVSGQSASCGMAIYEFLSERHGGRVAPTGHQNYRTPVPPPNP